VEPRDLEKRLDRVETKIDIVSDKINSIDSTLREQHLSLKEHMRRSDLLEAQMVPVQKHVAAVNGVLKFIGLIVPIMALLLTVYKIFR
jgi:uncharacterized coiled-coil protein SlyX